MEKTIIAIKNNFGLITKFVTIALLIVFILLPNYNEFFTYLYYIAIVLIILSSVFLIINIIQPKELIVKKEGKLYINKINKVIVLDPKAIMKIDVKYKRSRGYKYEFGTLIIYTKNNKVIKVYNVDQIYEASIKINRLINR